MYEPKAGTCSWPRTLRRAAAYRCLAKQEKARSSGTGVLQTRALWKGEISEAEIQLVSGKATSPRRGLTLQDLRLQKNARQQAECQALTAFGQGNGGLRGYSTACHGHTSHTFHTQRLSLKVSILGHGLALGPCFTEPHRAKVLIVYGAVDSVPSYESFFDMQHGVWGRLGHKLAVNDRAGVRVWLIPKKQLPFALACCTPPCPSGCARLCSSSRRFRRPLCVHNEFRHLLHCGISSLFMGVPSMYINEWHGVPDLGGHAICVTLGLLGGKHHVVFICPALAPTGHVMLTLLTFHPEISF